MNKVFAVMVLAEIPWTGTFPGILTAVTKATDKETAEGIALRRLLTKYPTAANIKIQSIEVKQEWFNEG